MKFKLLHVILFFLWLVITWQNNCYASGLGGQVRAMWVTRFEMDSKEKIDKFLDLAQKYNFNTLFVQVVGRGVAFYKSQILPMATVEKDFNPLEYTITQGHKKNLKIHAWVNMYYVWSKTESPGAELHIVNFQPGWIIVDYNGRSLYDYRNDFNTFFKNGGIFLDPASQSVQDYLYDLVTEIVAKYRVDGIHLDYIRYPSSEFGFDTASRQNFERLYGVDPVSLYKNKEMVENNLGRAVYWRLKKKWLDYRCANVSRLVSRIKGGIKATSPRVLLSAAVYADYSVAKFEKSQDWILWLNSSLLDFAVPMAYRKDNQKFESEINFASESSRNRPIIAGLGAYLISADQLKEQLIMVKELEKKSKNLKGFSIFSYDILQKSPDYFEIFK